MEGRERLVVRRDQAVSELLESGAQHGERGAQLVGDLVREPLPGPLRPLDLLRGGVEGVGQLGDLLATAVGHARAVVARRERARHPEEVLERRHETVRDHPRDHERDDHGEGGGRDEPLGVDGLVVAAAPEEVRDDRPDGVDREHDQ